MNKAELLKEIKMTYYEMQEYLLQKYGTAICDYFVTTECRSKSKKVGRTSEGLYCHHMDEDKGGNLSNPPQARMQPFEWQKKERLVYCNALEHLVLHMKICILRQNRKFKEPYDIDSFFTTGGVYMICHEINDMFINDGTSVRWKKRCFEEFKENYTDYIQIIKALVLYVEKSYKGEKSADIFLKQGSYVHFSDCDCEILKLSPKKDAILLRLPNGDEKYFSSAVALNQLTYADNIDRNLRYMASGYDVFYEQIYNDLLKCQITDIIGEYSEAFHVDFSTEKFLWGSEAINAIKK
ncbi:MAG: hypothetical protein GX284_04935 [Clostridiales bacterium]|nr:hypothetical protein [Clostridiales bacterium]